MMARLGQPGPGFGRWSNSAAMPTHSKVALGFLTSCIHSGITDIHRNVGTNKGRRTLTTHMTGVMVVWPRPMTPCRWRRHSCRCGGRIWRRSWRRWRLIGSIVLWTVRSVRLIKIRGCDIWMLSKALSKGLVAVRRIRRRWAKVRASRGVRRRRRLVGIIDVARFVRERLLVPWRSC